MAEPPLIHLFSPEIEALFDPARGYLHSVRARLQAHKESAHKESEHKDDEGRGAGSGHDREAVQAVYFHVRRPDWTTAMPETAKPDIEFNPHGSQVRLRCTVEPLGIPFRWTMSAVLIGTEAICTFDGEALGPFETNRTGMCVLLPQEVAGQSAIAKAIGFPVQSQPFPEIVRPSHPFSGFDLLELPRARLELQGGLFEIEDQRCWGDASFKIYHLTPPFPYQLAEGSTVRQRVVIRLKDRQPNATGGADVARSGQGMPHAGNASCPIPSEFLARLHFMNAAPAAPPVCDVLALADDSVTGWLEAAVHPQTHIFDPRLIMRNADALGPIAASLRQRHPRAQVRLHLHWGAAGDPRWHEALGTAWAASAARAALAGGADEVVVHGITPDQRLDVLAALAPA